MTTKKDFVDWCFNNLDGTEDKYDLGKLVWDYLSKENYKLATKVARLEKILDEFKLNIDRPTPRKKRQK